MADNKSKEARHLNMSHVKGKDTKPEVLVRKYLFSKGFRFRKNDSRYPGKPDILLPKYKTAIFINGCFWHRHPYCKYASTPETRRDFWEKKFLENTERDERNYRFLESMGWNVLIIWQCELKKGQFDTTMARVLNELQENYVQSQNYPLIEKGLTNPYKI